MTSIRLVDHGDTVAAYTPQAPVNEPVGVAYLVDGVWYFQRRGGQPVEVTDKEAAKAHLLNPSRQPRRPRRSRPDANVILYGQVLPDEFAEALRMLHRVQDRRLNAVLRDARDEGWTAVPLAAALGMTRQAVDQRADRAKGDAWGIDIPPAPRRVPVQKPAKPTIPAATIQRLKEMAREAKTVNGGTPADDPRRELGARLTAELAALVEEGFAVNAIAKALGVNHNAIRFRLGRYGYQPLPPSQMGTIYKGRPASFATPQGECLRGHRLSGANLRITSPGGARVCRACERIRQDAYRARKRVAA